MVINVSAALDSNSSELMVVEREAQGSRYVDGIYEQGGAETFRIRASVQQPSPDDLQILPEGERNKDILKFTCASLVKTTDDKERTMADHILYNNRKYKVISVQDFIKYGYAVALGARV